MKSLYSRILILSFFLLPYITFTQPLSKSEFRKLFTQGNLMMLEHFYDTACRTFLLLHKADPSNANINYKIGYCYLKMPAYKIKSIPYLENAIKQTAGNYREDDPSEKNAPEDAIYLLGQAYHYAYRFDEAMVQYNKFRDIVAKWNINYVKEIDLRIEQAKNAKLLVEKPVDCTIINLSDSVNSEFPDYSPLISADEEVLIFTSRREGTGGKENVTINDEFFEDIWICERGPYGTWTKAKSISRTINTDGNEATIGLSADGQQLYVYRDDNGDGNIYISKLDGNYWTPPYKMDASNINSPHWEPSACISADGNFMYFVSNRPGGFGGRDIYQCKRLPNREWSHPENLGPTINTPYDEDAPFMHPDGITFFFSSTGHNSMGGFDVFYSTKVANNVWTKPINMGYPINTTDDDIYFVTSSDGRRAYYASFRPEGKGEKDIYLVTMPKPFVQSVAILAGWLKNKDGSPIPKNSFVNIKMKDGQSLSCKPNEASGKFVQTLFPGKEYELTIETNGKKIFYDRFFLPQDSSYQNLGRAFFQRTIYVGDTTRLFSQNPVKDTISRIQMVPLEGKILLSENPDNPAQNTTLHLLNQQGYIIASAVTDSKGQFSFQNIPANQNYIIKIDENNPILKSHQQFYLANTNGKIVMSSTKEKQFFLFKHVNPDINKTSAIETVDTPIATVSLRGKITGGKKADKPIEKLTINLLDESGKIIRSSTTEKTGFFVFENLPADKMYSLSISEKDPNLKEHQNIFLSNEKHKVIKKALKTSEYFIFTNLTPDLNKLSAIDLTDTTKLVPMKGRIMKNLTEGIEGVDLILTDNKGRYIQREKTGASGLFRFEKLFPDNNYTIKFTENEPLLAGLKKVYLADETGRIIKEIDIQKKKFAFRNLPSDLSQLPEIKNIYIPTARDTLTAVKVSSVKITDDSNFDFVVYFPYNQKEIDISVSSFISLMNKVERVINEKGIAQIIIAASSSTVPTKSYPSNEALAQERANEVKDKVRASLSLKNLDPAKIQYEINAKVQGPAYKNDAIKNRMEYEKWQFVKVIVR